MNISSNNGASASQVVMHSHIHFIPRFDGDGLKLPPVIMRKNTLTKIIKKWLPQLEHNFKVMR
ncbi:HIT domain-containing protein [Lactobacillus sp. R2/2]|nr:HIT domain-containing protein [Lactobacillus sp. R2/2]